MAPKTVDKLTDAEKKKIKQANKAKANPGKAEAKAETNLKRRIARGQVVDPNVTTNKKAECVIDKDESGSNVPKTAKKSEAEKAEKIRLKLLAVEKALIEKQQIKEKQRIQDLIDQEKDVDCA